VPIVLGIDSSTQSVKVQAHDLDSGEIVGTGRALHQATTPPRSEQDPNTWWEALVAATTEATANVDKSSVVAISVGGQQHGMVVTDSSNVPLHPGKLWNDTESAPQADRLVERLGATAWAEAVGSVPVAAFTVTKLAWLAETHPAVYDTFSKISLPHDWLTTMLTGRHVTDRGDASGTGYWSPIDQQYRLDLLALTGDRDFTDALPSVLAPFEKVGALTAIAGKALALPENVVVGPGTGDNMAAALGLGLLPGDVVISLGTSGTVYAVSASPTSDPTAAVAGFADASGNYLPLVCTLNAMKVSDTFARLLGVSITEFGELALNAKPGANGLALVPYLDGERTPNRPTASGELKGFRNTTSREDIARATMEGVVCGLLDGLDALTHCGVPANGRLFLIGGGSRSAAYRQIVADLTQREVLVPDADEHVATGAALQAAAVANGATSISTIASQWGLGGGSTTVPTPGVDTAEIRAAYALARG
jgi:xylulokinase